MNKCSNYANHLAVFKRRIDKLDVLFLLLLCLLILQVDAVESDVESNVEYKGECVDHDEEEETGKNYKNSISHGGSNRANGDAGRDQSKDCVLENQEGFHKSTPLFSDSMKKKAPENKSRDDNDHTEVGWCEDSIHNVVSNQDQRDGEIQDHEDSADRADNLEHLLNPIEIVVSVFLSQEEVHDEISNSNHQEDASKDLHQN